MSVRPLQRLVVVSAMLGATACPDVGPLDMMTRRDSPLAEYRVHFLAPPWEVVEQEGGTLILRVPSARSEVAPSAVAPAYELTVHVEPSVALTLIDAKLETNRNKT